MHSLAEYGLKGFESLIFIIFLKQISELSHFLALLTASYHFYAVDLEANDFVCLTVFLTTCQVALEMVLSRLLLLAQLLPAKLVVAFHSGAFTFMVLHFLDGEGNAAHAACDLVLGIDLHNYL